MYSDTFLTMCPQCNTVRESPRIHLHLEVTCAICSSRFTADDNYVDIEEDTFVPDLTPVIKAKLHSKKLQEGMTTSDADRDGCNDFDRPTSFHTEHDKHKPFDWTLVSFKGLEEASFGTREHYNEKPVGGRVWPDESMAAQGGHTPKEKKHSESLATWGIALRKPSREKRKVKSYSPSRESGLRKKRKLGLEKGSRVKKYRRNQDSGRNFRDNFSDEDVRKGKTTTEGTVCKPPKVDSENFSEEFKNYMTAEIKRQVLEGLGEESKKLVREIQVVEVEELLPQTPNSVLGIQDAVSEDQNFMAKVKLMATILIPVTLRASDGSLAGSPECPKSRENSEDVSKGREVAEDEPNDIKEPKPRGQMKSEKPSVDEPLFKYGCEEVDVPESEYYDFEFNKSEDKFAPDQIWASYDSGKDMMPRDYVEIKKVVSIEPFKVYIALLEPAGLSELGNPLSCGEFRTENGVRLMDEINCFSHLMRCRKGQNGRIYIYPAEKEVWALYKEWGEIDPIRKIEGGYDVVQVVAVKEDLTVSVVPLVSHKGSRTVFHMQETQPFQIHKKDFNRFSHQIATYEIIGSDGVEGCIELDPAAIPFHSP